MNIIDSKVVNHKNQEKRGGLCPPLNGLSFSSFEIIKGALSFLRGNTGQTRLNFIFHKRLEAHLATRHIEASLDHLARGDARS